MFTIILLQYAHTLQSIDLGHSLHLCKSHLLTMSLRPAVYFKSLAIFLATTALFWSCEKSQRDLDTETLSAEENAIAYHVFDDVFREVHRFSMRDSILNDTGIIQWFDDCIKKAELSDTVPVFPIILDLKYVDLEDTTTCQDGFKRRGKISAVFTGKYLNSGTTITFRFVNYRKDNFDIDGEMVLTNLGVNDNGRRHFLMEVSEATIAGNGFDFSWGATNTIEWIAGSSTDGIIDDDIFEYVEGISSGTNSRGNTYYSEIDTPYRADCSCQWFTAGTAELYVKNLQTRFIRYGVESVCDNKFIQERDLTTFELSIPY